ncbi:MAG: zinc-ribbon domain-containing protein [Planctomycetaceae bacterium]|nr:zinc-ribbon domain-containing protein [Planctomycetaceae bacterium]
MERHTSESEDWDDEPEGEDATVPCPYCGAEIYEDSVRCPHCGEYISEEDAGQGRKPWWILVGVLLCLGAIWVWIVSR